MNQLVLGGYLVLQFTYSDIVERPSYVVDRILRPWEIRPAAGVAAATFREAGAAGVRLSCHRRCFLRRSP